MTDSPLARADAEQIVAGKATHENGYFVVSLAAAELVLGTERFQRLLKDKIRGVQPFPGFVYAWNVTDYLVNPSMGA